MDIELDWHRDKEEEEDKQERLMNNLGLVFVVDFYISVKI
jgi:hypothetical protein